MHTFHKRHPWIVSFASALVFLAVALVGTPIGNRIESLAHLPINSGILIQQFLLVLISALAVMLFGGWREAGFDKPFQLKAFLYACPLLIGPIFLLFYSGIAATAPLQIIMLIVFTVMIGFAEETLCRGMMVQAFLPRGMMPAALFSSLIFGSMHLIQIFYGMSIGMALLYAFYAALLGFGFAAPYLRSGGAIWPLITVHALFDFLGKLGHGWGAQAQPTSSFEVLVRLVLAILVGVYSLWLLRRKVPVAPLTKVTIETS